MSGPATTHRSGTATPWVPLVCALACLALAPVSAPGAGPPASHAGEVQTFTIASPGTPH
jgi:hypothetical protein